MIFFIEEDVKCCLDGGVDKFEVDNGCVNGIFDLNCLVFDFFEFLFGEKYIIYFGFIVGNCEDEVKSGMNSGGMIYTDKIEGQLIFNENDDDEVGVCVFIMSFFEGMIFQFDLNLMEENEFGGNSGSFNFF